MDWLASKETLVMLSPEIDQCINSTVSLILEGTGTLRLRRRSMCKLVIVVSSSLKISTLMVLKVSSISWFMAKVTPADTKRSGVLTWPSTREMRRRRHGKSYLIYFINN
jgi:hypothetical protein